MTQSRHDIGRLVIAVWFDMMVEEEQCRKGNAKRIRRPHLGVHRVVRSDSRLRPGLLIMTACAGWTASGLPGSTIRAAGVLA
jgi:hypothetical protein